MFVLGLTGGIGSGKSRVLYELEKVYGAYICEADKLAHQLMSLGTGINASIVNEFGAEILDDSGNIDRGRLGKIVFSNEKKLEKLNNIVHPGVKNHILQDINDKKKSGISLYVIEAALLIQDGYTEICDEIWYVWAAKETRIRRLMEGRGYSYEKCISVMENQPEDESYKKYAKLTINNDFDFDFSSKQLKVELNNRGVSAIM